MRRWTGIVSIGLAVAVLAWFAAGAYAVAGIDQPKYDVTATREGYEVRRYAPMLVAETDMASLGGGDRGRGFQILAGYIFGGNRARDSIAMTAPVVMDPTAGTTSAATRIAMTAPVVMDPATPPAGVPPPDAAGTAARPTGTMQFVMPHRFTSLDQLPVPNDARVRLRQVPGRTVAATRFSWYATSGRVAEKSAALLAALARDGVAVRSSPMLATYDPPFTLPFMQRHEIMVEIAP